MILLALVPVLGFSFRALLRSHDGPAPSSHAAGLVSPEIGEPAPHPATLAGAGSSRSTDAGADARTRAPITAIPVHLLRSADHPAVTITVGALKHGRLVRSAQVRSGQSVHLMGLEPGAYELAVARPSLPSWSVGPLTRSGRARPDSIWQPFDRVEVGEEPGEVVELELLAGASLEGVVLDATGQPLPGVHVPLRRSSAASSSDARAVRTDESGAFAFHALQPSEYRLGPVSEGDSGSRASARAVQLTSGQRAWEELRVEVLPGVIRGRIVGADGAPRPGVWVRASSEDAPAGAGRSDEEGRFELAGLPLDQVRLHLRESSRVQRDPSLPRPLAEPVFPRESPGLDVGDLVLPSRPEQTLRIQLQGQDLDEVELFVVEGPVGDLEWKRMSLGVRWQASRTGAGLFEVDCSGAKQPFLTVWVERQLLHAEAVGATGSDEVLLLTLP